jgi:hypothetical protein
MAMPHVVNGTSLFLSACAKSSIQQTCKLSGNPSSCVSQQQMPVAASAHSISAVLPPIVGRAKPRRHMQYTRPSAH